MDFTVQYETWHDGKWRPVVRFDLAHGQPHRDLLDREGRQIGKDWFSPEIGLKEAMRQAIDDVVSSWPTYLAAFLEAQP